MDSINVIWNQKLPPLTDEYWRNFDSSFTNCVFNNGIATMTWLRDVMGYRATIRVKDITYNTTIGEKWYISYEINPSKTGLFSVEFAGGAIPSGITCYANQWQRISFIETALKTGYYPAYLMDYRSSNSGTKDRTCSCRNAILINLTQMFGADNEPNLKEFETQCALNGVDLTQYQEQITSEQKNWTLPHYNYQMMERKKQILTNQPHLATVSSGNTSDSEVIAHFKTNDTFPLKECIINIQPRQSGSGTPSPDNIRIINGYTKINLTRCGINLLNCDGIGTSGQALNQVSKTSGINYVFNRNTNNSATSITATGTRQGSNTFLNLNYHGSDDCHYAKVSTYGYSSLVAIRPVGTSNSWSIPSNWTGPSQWLQMDLRDHSVQGVTWYRIQWYPFSYTGAVSDTVYPMVCLRADEGCSFEPYNGDIYTINFENDIGAVYGGQLNLLTGELTVEYKLCTITGEESGLTYNWDGVLLVVPDSISSNNTYIIKACSHTNHYITGGGFFNSSRSTNPNTTVNDICVSGSQGSQLRFRKRDLDPDFTKDIELYRTWLRQQNANGTPLQIVYKLQTPQTYQLTPQTIRTLRGVNNIWSDAGPVSLQYWTH